MSKSYNDGNIKPGITYNIPFMEKNPKLIEYEISEKNKKVEKLKSIYDNETFNQASLYDYPYSNKMSNYTLSARYTPKVLMNFGKYKQKKTLYQVYKTDIGYFNWLLKNKLYFGNMETSLSIRYTEEDTH